METTIHELVDAVHTGATEQGMDLSLGDVSWIISTFLEGLIHGGPPSPVLDTALQNLADEVSSVTDE